MVDEGVLGRDHVEIVRVLAGVREYSAGVHGPNKRDGSLSW